MTDFRAVGGGSKSDAWIQISADILGRPFVRPNVNEAGVLGAAIWPGWAVGSFPRWKPASVPWFSLERTFEPDPKNRLYTTDGLPNTSVFGR